MDFANLFGGPAVVAKQLERRWTECSVDANTLSTTDNSNAHASAPASTLAGYRRRAVPYLRRNLLYCRDPYDKPRFPRWRHEERSADARHDLPKEDMLSKLFGHKEPLHYNDALLADPAELSDQEDSSLVANTSTPTALSTPTRKRKPRGTAGGGTPDKSPVLSPNRFSAPTTNRPTTTATTTTPSSQPSRHTKVFYAVEMAHPQSPGVALSPTTVEMKYGKAFPPYEPRVVDGTGNGRWVRPESPKSAYALFADLSREQARRFLQRRERNDEKKVDEKLQKLWANGNTTTHLYWKQEEEWDKQRYMHEKTVYARARQLAEGYAAPMMEEKKDDVHTGKLSVAAASPGQASDSRGPGSSSRKRQARDVYTQTSRNIVPRRATNVYYHYLYLKDGMPVAQVEQRRDCRCPLCYQNCVTDIGLLMHCQLVHGPTLSFEAAKDEDANLHIGVRSEKRNSRTFPPWKDVAADESCVRSCLSRPQPGWDPANAFHERPITNSRLTNFVYVRGDQLPCLADIKFFKRPFACAAYLDPTDRRKKSETLREQGADENAIKRLFPDDEVPIRQYYHSKTNLPMYEGEWDEDSDDDPDDGWREKMGEQLLDEFDDVSTQEKQFMKLWNRHMNGSDEVVADRSIPGRCMDFVKLHGDKLAALGLRQTLLLHFCNLWDEEVISSKHVSTLMSYYDQRCKDASNKARNTTLRTSPRTPRSPTARRKTPLKHSSNGTSSTMSPSRKRARRCVAM